MRPQTRMNLGRTLDRIGDAALGFAAIGFTSLGFLLVWGRVINSQAAMSLEAALAGIPLVGPLLAKSIRALRASTDQAYDPAGEN